MSEKDGGPAFPNVGGTEPNDLFPSYGMSLRDYFAGQALAGLLANPNTRETRTDTALAAYFIADALLKARTQGE
jgi:hypothetical protein